LRLRQLVCFVRVCELGSITQAATQLHIAQPALGLQIRSLEDEFGASLFVRSSRGVTTTPAGELVLEWARGVIKQHSEVRRRLKALPGEKPLSLRLGMTSSLTQLLAVPLIESTREALPDLRLKIIEGMSQYIAQWVEDEHIDIGLGFGPFNSQSVDSDPLMQDRLFYLSAPGTPDGTISLAEVLSLPLALPDEQNSVRHTVDAAARDMDLPVIGMYEIASIQAAREIAHRGIAGAIAPYGGVAAEHQRGELSVRRIVSPTLERTLLLMRRKDRPLTQTEEKLVTLIKSNLKAATRQRAPEGAYVWLEQESGLSG
jgi:LysR family transcriptional regulator, nitrogen assimilation regulatory protein